MANTSCAPEEPPNDAYGRPAGAADLGLKYAGARSTEHGTELLEALVVLSDEGVGIRAVGPQHGHAQEGPPNVGIGIAGALPVGRNEIGHIVEQALETARHTRRIGAAPIVLRQAWEVDGEILEPDVGDRFRQRHWATERCSERALVRTMKHVVDAGREDLRDRANFKWGLCVKNEFLTQRIDECIATRKEQLPGRDIRSYHAHDDRRCDAALIECALASGIDATLKYGERIALRSICTQTDHRARGETGAALEQHAPRKHVTIAPPPLVSLPSLDKQTVAAPAAFRAISKGPVCGRKGGLARESRPQPPRKGTQT